MNFQKFLIVFVFVFFLAILGLSLLALNEIDSKLPDYAEEPSISSLRTYEFTMIEDGEVVVKREEYRYCSAQVTETALWVTCFDSDGVHQNHIFRALEFKDLTK